MASLTFPELLTKISYVFKSDFYIYHNKYLVGGEESEQDTIATYVCDLQDESIKLLEENDLNIGEIVYVQNVKKYKQENFDKKYISVVKLPQTKTLVEKTMQSVVDIVLKVKQWDVLPISDEEASKMIDKGETLTLFKNREDIPNVTIGKDMFPMVTMKNWTEVFYHVKPAKNDDELNKLFTRFNIPYFTLYGLTRYMTI